MMRRRKAVRALISGLGSIWAFISCAPLRKEDSSLVSEREQPGRKLEHDLSVLAKRNYAEEGIPMFLVCENLAAKDRSSAKASQRSEGVPLAEELRRNTDALVRIQPGATEDDLPKILEVLAERDFGSTLARRTQ